MLRESIKSAETVEGAIKLACEELGINEGEAEFEIIEPPKKSIFGKVKSPAKIRVFITKEPDKVDIVQAYLNDVLIHFGLKNVEQTVEKDDNYIRITLNGDNLGPIIGRRGETLDSLQYLTTLVANRGGGSYLRVIIDSGDFRNKGKPPFKNSPRKYRLKC